MDKIKKEIVRSIRLDKATDTIISAIANYDDRNITNVINRLINDAIHLLIECDFDFKVFCEDNIEDWDEIKRKLPHKLSLIPPQSVTITSTALTPYYIHK